ncbi:MAG: SDR family oxidoreductase [Turicibacter sp.]|nr:SDR family oxidoreductase [Turicibacter sp.]
MNSNIKSFPKGAPPQFQTQQPGWESLMEPKPIYEHYDYKHQGEKLRNKVAIITGGDSGIGRAVSMAYAKEGARLAIVYHHSEFEDARQTQKIIEGYGKECLLIEADLAKPQAAPKIAEKVIGHYKQINILVNNAGVQFPQNKISDIRDEDLHHTFNVNFFAAFYLIQSCLPHMSEGDCIINTTSVVAFEGNPTLLDYTASKGALTSFSRALSEQLAPKGIRVNCVAPGPIWTPLIPSSFNAQQVASFGSGTPMKRMGQPVEVAPAYVMLASKDGSYMTGATIHINGGTKIN